jgi:rfaE bifunctional protein nucleotidyltransferase chain/domain
MIVPIDEFPKIREKEFPDKKVVCTSGFFDPIHPGHISCLLESKKFGDVLVVIIDGDSRAIVKKGKPFIPATDRAEIVDAMRGVDYVVIYEKEGATECVEAVEIIKPDVFTKGGDWDPERTIPETDIMEEVGGTIEYGVGKDKVWCSSNYLQEWVDFVNSKKD